MGCGASNVGDQMVKQQKQQDYNTQISVDKINKAFQGFNPQFYNSIGQAYQNYALPQFGQNFNQTQNQLGFKLAGQGLGDSSIGQNLYNQLGQQRSQGLQQIAGNALGQQQDFQRQIGQEKSRLIGQAQSATNPGAIGQQALATASGFSAPSSFQPIGNAFSNFANLYLANQMANSYNPQTQALNNAYPALGFSGGNSFLPSTYYSH